MSGPELTTERRLARFEALLNEQRQRIDELEQVNALLRAAGTPPSAAPSVDGHQPAVPATSTIARRTLLTKGLAAAGVAAAGAVLLDAPPAAAADGANLIVGSVNQTATSPTGIAIGGSAASYGFGLTDNSRPVSDVRPCLSGHAKGANFTAAVEALAQNTATGVYARSQDGVAVEAVWACSPRRSAAAPSRRSRSGSSSG